MLIAQFSAAYEVGRWDGLTGSASHSALDAYAGGRVWWQKADADLAFSGTVNVLGLSRTASGSLSADGSVQWIDPVVGLRLRHQFTPSLNFSLSGDIGGFGAGSKFSWQTLAVLNYELYRSSGISWNAMVGYKALYVGLVKDSGLSEYEYKMTMHGPILGVTARF